MTRRVLEAVLKTGARIAQPGIYQAQLLNGRIDLTQAEAVIDLIESKRNYPVRRRSISWKAD